MKSPNQIKYISECIPILEQCLTKSVKIRNNLYINLCIYINIHSFLRIPTNYANHALVVVKKWKQFIIMMEYI